MEVTMFFLPVDMPPQTPPKIALHHFCIPPASIIKIIPQQQDKTYENLPGCDPKDREKIIEIFSTIGSHGNMSLLMHHQKRVRKLGKEIEHVHPLKLLGCIFSTFGMRVYMDDIYHNSWKWSNVMKGIGANLDHELQKDSLFKYLDDFSKEVNIPKEKIIVYCQNRDWEELVKFLIYYPLE
jgi:hypothetical protein